VTSDRDDVHVRAAAILADKYADPWLKLARYEELTDDLLDRLDEAVNYLRRVVQADRDDTKMGYPIPGDSCLAACIGLEVMRFLDDVGALTDGVGTDGKRTVGVMAGSNEAASLPEAGRSPTPSVSAPDIDVVADKILADMVREGFTRVEADARLFALAPSMTALLLIEARELIQELHDNLVHPHPFDCESCDLLSRIDGLTDRRNG